MESRNYIRILDRKGKEQMKNIPIVVLNKDRLHPLQLLIESLHSRGYDNITIIDNQSTYEPLLKWYEESGVHVFHNTIPETLYDTGTFYRLAVQLNHSPFNDIVKGHYVFTDSDVVPDVSVPENFIDDMIEVLTEFNVHKVGFGLKLSDLPPGPRTDQVIAMERSFWDTKIPHSKYELFNAPIDTTFAVYGPGNPPLWAHGIRMGGDYIAQHMPWYYDIDKLPDDELYYIQNLQPNRGPTYSMQVKQQLIGI